MTTHILPPSPTILPRALTEVAQQSTAVAPSPRQINDFAQWMNAARLQQQSSEIPQKMSVSPVQASSIAPLSESAMLLGALQSQGQEIKKRFRPDALSDVQEPVIALKMQGEVAMSILELELLTKVTNGITQSINKLTSMA